jgi:hypothetical protein
MADETDSPVEETVERTTKFRAWVYQDLDAPAARHPAGSRLELFLIVAIVLAVWINAGYIIVRKFF